MPPDQAANPLANPLIPGLLIFVIFYFLLIKPQKDKQKQLDSLKKDLKKNDQIVTVGGIHGTIVLVKDKTVIVRVDDNVKLEFDKEAVTSVTKTKV